MDYTPCVIKTPLHLYLLHQSDVAEIKKFFISYMRVSINYLSPSSDEGAGCRWQPLGEVQQHRPKRQLRGGTALP